MGRRQFREEIKKRNIVVIATLVENFGQKEWELYIDGPEVKMALKAHPNIIGDQVLRLWNDNEDPEEYVVKKFFGYAIHLLKKGVTVEMTFEVLIYWLRKLQNDAFDKPNYKQIADYIIGEALKSTG